MLSFFLENPIFDLLLAAFCLFIVYLEMPPKVSKRTGKKVPFSQRLSKLGRTGWGLLIPGVLFAVGGIAGVIDLITS